MRKDETTKADVRRVKLHVAEWFYSLSPALKKSLFIITIYIMFSLIWILVTDAINFSLLTEASGQQIISSLKGCLYVIMTGVLIFILIYPAFQKISASQIQLAKVNSDLLIERENLICSEKALKKSEALLRAIFDQATVGISIGYDESSIVTDDPHLPSVNPAFTRISGRTISELRNTSWGDLTYPDDLKDDFIRIEKLNTDEVYDTEKRIIMPDGSPLWVHMIISPVYLDSQHDSVRLCIIEDISRRKELEASLDEYVRSRTILLDNLQGMAYRCLYDGVRKMLIVSQGCHSLTGYSKESLISNDVCYCKMVVPTYHESLHRKLEAAMATGSRFREEYQIITAEGQHKWVLEQGEGVVDDNGQVVAIEGLIVDITKKKEQDQSA